MLGVQVNVNSVCEIVDKSDIVPFVTLFISGFILIIGVLFCGISNVSVIVFGTPTYILSTGVTGKLVELYGKYSIDLLLNKIKININNNNIIIILIFKIGFIYIFIYYLF